MDYSQTKPDVPFASQNRYNHLLCLKEQAELFWKVIHNKHGSVQIKSWNDSQISQESAIFWAVRRPKDYWHDTHSFQTTVISRNLLPFWIFAITI